MMKVYHLDWSDESTLRERCLDAAEAAANGRIAELFAAGKYAMVAELTDELECEPWHRCEVAWRLTNTIDRLWWQNPGVEACFDGSGCRSTSMGDIVQLSDGSRWIAVTFGFKRVTMPKYRVGVSRVERVVYRTTLEVEAASPTDAANVADAMLEDGDDVATWAADDREVQDYSYGTPVPVAG
jgi:hypothetical protein